MKKIDLGYDKEALVDNADYERIKNQGWCLKNTKGENGRFYSVATMNYKTTPMHRFILGAKKGEFVDHVNGNGLDNRRSNIRICTISQNHQNRRKSPNTSSKYKGVWFNKKTNRWIATIKSTDMKWQKSLGVYKTELEAAKAYDTEAVKCFGEFARTNLK